MQEPTISANLFSDAMKDFFDRQLSADSTAFLRQLYDRNVDEFNQLLVQINQLKSPAGGALFLNKNHMDTVFSLLQKQMALPENSMLLLHFYAERNPDAPMIIDSLRGAHAPRLVSQAVNTHFMHHTIRHSVEVMSRAMFILTLRFQLFLEPSSCNKLIQSLFSFFIQFHDFDQRHDIAETTAEILTANRLLDLLRSRIHGFSVDDNLVNILDYMAQQIIVLGTTMIFSKKNTSDLYQIYALVEAAYERAGFVVFHPSNQNLINLVKTTLLVAGVCDKNPASIPHIAGLEALKDTVTDPYYSKLSCINAFFRTDKFSEYYMDKSATINQRAFLITLVPHISMCFELAAKKGDLDARRFIPFIREAQVKRINTFQHNDYMIWLKQALLVRNVREVFERIFFSAIEQEKSFCLSQVQTLHFVHEKLMSLTGSALVEASVPMTDAKNLDALQKYYVGLSDQHKHSLIFDLVMTVILQAGATRYIGNTFSSSRDILFATPRSPCDIIHEYSLGPSSSL